MAAEPEIVHALAGVRFPARAGGFVRGAATYHDTSGHDVGVAYHGVDHLLGVAITVFVYPAERSEDDEAQSVVDSVLVHFPTATVIEHRRSVVRDIEGFWVTFQLPVGGSDRELSTLWLFASDRWFIKYRCTFGPIPRPGDVRAAVEELVRQIGFPDTSQRMLVNRQGALARAAATFKALHDWSPNGTPSTQGILRSVGELRSQANITDAIATLRHALEQGADQRGLHAELGRLRLLTGDLLDACEECMAEEELETSEEEHLEAALKAYVGDDVVYDGGWGASVETPVIIRGAATPSIRINAIHRYLEFALGPRGKSWKLDGASLIAQAGRLFDAMRVNLDGGRQVIVFFLLDSCRAEDLHLPLNDVLGTFHTGGTARGEPQRLSSHGPEVTTSLQFSHSLKDPGSSKFVLSTLMTHLSQTLTLAPDEML
jgi:hypothetical protein